MVEFEVHSRRTAGEALHGSDADSYQWCISIGDLNGSRPCSGFRSLPDSQRIRLEFDDVSVDQSQHGYYRATREQVRHIVRFCRRVEGKCLIHCEAGISRSSAAAIILCATQLGPGKEKEAVAMVMAQGPDKFYPNDWLVEVADSLLGREGRLGAALAAYKDAGRIPQFRVGHDI